MKPTITNPEPLDRVALGHTQWEARARFPAAYWEFVTVSGFGTPDLNYRVPERYAGPHLDAVQTVDALTHPAPDKVFRTPAPAARVFAMIGLCNDYPFLLELTTPDESPVFLWQFNDGESLGAALHRADDVGIVSSAYQVAGSFEEFIASFTDEPATWEQEDGEE